MHPANSFEERAESLRRQTLVLLQTLRDKGRALELPPAPAALEPLEHKLAENAYEVLVVGEAKRGKSTFVNALIGRDLLPTDVDIATSQVFRVAPAAREGYRLRFEDDSQQVITTADLPRYGSQVMADVDGVPRLDQILRWIEVDVPTRFLPANVRILDTPGLGALYAAHAEITHRFVSRADAVVFVLDSQAPIGAPEVDFIETLLKVTPQLFFIQTKIDLFRREQWQEIQRRNQDILAQRFGDRLAEARVWPISSTNLSKAAQTGDQDYLQVSRHKELAAALQAFLFRVSGWSRAAEALVVGKHYHDVGCQTLVGRLENVLEESKQKRAENQQRALVCRKQFDADWGERGQRRCELLDQLEKLVTIGKQSIRHALQPGGEIELRFRSRIEAADLEQVKQWGPKLASEVASQTVEHWTGVQKNLEAKCMALLGPLATALEGQMLPLSSAALVEKTAPSPAHGASAGTAEKWVKHVRNAVFAGSAAHLILGPVLTATAPIWLAPGVAILAVGIPMAIIESKNRLRAAQQELLRHLGEVLQVVRNRLLFEVDLTAGRGSLVDECFRSFEQAFREQVGQLSRTKLDESQAEIKRLEEEANLDDGQRRARAEQLRKHLAAWDALSRVIQEIEKALQDMQRNVASPVPA